MLVLSRKVGQSLIIGGNIRLKVIEVRGQQVRVGIDAPEHVPVVRQEILEEVVEANLSAAAADPAGLADIAAAWRDREKRSS